MKSFFGILFALHSFNELSADPYWEQGKTEDRHEPQ
jgi:hypothetical protein